MLSLAAVSPTYASAQIIVDALSRGSWEEAYAEMAKYTGTELNQVADKAIAIGGDPDTVQTLLASLNTGEIINVTGTAPVVAKPFPWLWLALALIVIGGGVYVFKTRRKRAGGLLGTGQFYQDGRDFYDEDSGKRIASYPALVENDNDTEGAKAARRKFLQEHPQYR
jgi:hypothetical protein